MCWKFLSMQSGKAWPISRCDSRMARLVCDFTSAEKGAQNLCIYIYKSIMYAYIYNILIHNHTLHYTILRHTTLHYMTLLCITLRVPSSERRCFDFPQIMCCLRKRRRWTLSSPRNIEGACGNPQVVVAIPVLILARAELCSQGAGGLIDLPRSPRILHL